MDLQRIRRRFFSLTRFTLGSVMRDGFILNGRWELGTILSIFNILVNLETKIGSAFIAGHMLVEY
jgi:hypothetical protein